MIIPDYLKEGDRVGFVAPARSITPDEVEPARRLLHDWGLQVITGGRLFMRHHQFAGSDEERASEMQRMLDDPDIRCIMCVRGGYGTIRIIEHLDFSRFIQAPKWVVGFSDITVLHVYLNQVLGVESIHGPMPFTLTGKQACRENLESLRNVLFGNPPSYTIDGNPLNRTGSAIGVVFGGNLSILYSLRGTTLDPVTAGKILFIEEVDEYRYHLDRMMMNMRMGAKLEGILGLVCGGLTDIRDNEIPFGKNEQEIISESTRLFSFPVCHSFPSGHGEKNLSLIMGRRCELTVEKKDVKLRFMKK